MCNRVIALLLLLSGLFAVHARADKVHLQGGAVLEGRVSRVGDKILVEVESGTLSLEAESVIRIESGPSALETVLVRRAALRNNDLAARLLLADYCRDHQLLSCERELLREVLEIDPNHAQARARLGFVRGPHGSKRALGGASEDWLTREEQLAAQGLVKRAGLWISPEEARLLDEAERERKRAELLRQQAEDELLSKRSELSAERARSDQRRRERAAQDSSTTSMWFPYPARNVVCPIPGLLPPSAPRPFVINGVRDPRDYFR